MATADLNSILGTTVADREAARAGAKTAQSLTVLRQTAQFCALMAAFVLFTALSAVSAKLRRPGRAVEAVAVGLLVAVAAGAFSDGSPIPLIAAFLTVG